MNNNPLNNSTFNDADIVIFGAPFDETCTYRKGTAQGPSAIRENFYSLETYSPYQNRDIEDVKVHDIGDLNLKKVPIKQVIDQIRIQTLEIIKTGKTPVLLGGEHLVTLGAFKAVLEHYPDICIIHFDAHADMLSGEMNHGTVMRNCQELIGQTSKPPYIFQFGIRSGAREEFSTKTFQCLHDFKTLKQAIKRIGKRPVYLSIDLDILDPSQFPGTGTPEAGGVTFLQLLDATKQIFTSLNVVACDIVELSPDLDQSGISTALACKFLREVLLLCKRH